MTQKRGSVRSSCAERWTKDCASSTSSMLHSAARNAPPSPLKSDTLTDTLRSGHGCDFWTRLDPEFANPLGKTTIWTHLDVAGRPAIGFVMSRSAVRVRSPAPIESITYRDVRPGEVGLCQHHVPPSQPSVSITPRGRPLANDLSKLSTRPGPAASADRLARRAVPVGVAPRDPLTFVSATAALGLATSSLVYFPPYVLPVSREPSLSNERPSPRSPTNQCTTVDASHQYFARTVRRFPAPTPSRTRPCRPPSRPRARHLCLALQSARVLM